MPERHAFFAKLDSTGMKLAMVPILDPPKMAQIKTMAPKIFVAFFLLIYWAIALEFSTLKFIRLLK